MGLEDRKFKGRMPSNAIQNNQNSNPTQVELGTSLQKSISTDWERSCEVYKHASGPLCATTNSCAEMRSDFSFKGPMNEDNLQ